MLNNRCESKNPCKNWAFPVNRLYHVRAQSFLNGRPFVSTLSTLPASVHKHPDVYKRSANMTG